MAGGEMLGEERPKVLTREWTSREGWRDTRLGMWAWLVQRGAAVALLLDFGVPLRWHRALFWLALGSAAALFVLVWTGRWY